jgi:hypothetical protein
MDILADLIKILLPAALVLYAMYMTVNAFLVKEFEKRLVDLKTKNTELVLPTRLQAYERMCLFLERVSPHNLILRLSNPDYNAVQFQQVLLHEIREEFNHNLSQQVYMTDDAWLLVKNAKEEVVGLINAAAEKVDREAPSVELAKMIFESLLSRADDPTSRALKYIKDEIRQVF